MAEAIVKSGSTVTAVKKARKPRTALTETDRGRVIEERVKLAATYANNNVPDTMRGEAAKLLLLGNVQLLNRIKKAGR